MSKLNLKQLAILNKSDFDIKAFLEEESEKLSEFRIHVDDRYVYLPNEVGFHKVACNVMGVSRLSTDFLWKRNHLTAPHSPKGSETLLVRL